MIKNDLYALPGAPQRQRSEVCFREAYIRLKLLNSYLGSLNQLLPKPVMQTKGASDARAIGRLRFNTPGIPIE